MRILIIMGVSGAGKTTIGQLLARELGWEYVDADDLHSAENRRKMHAGQALTNDDRRPWLQAIRQLIEGRVAQDRSAVIACSALKQSYRDVLAAGLPQVSFIYLKGSRELIASRLAKRPGHFMNPLLLQSQFDTLEEPAGALTVDVASSPAEIVAEIRRKLALQAPA